MENKESTNNPSENKLNQPVMPPIPDINSIPPIPDIGQQKNNEFSNIPKQTFQEQAQETSNNKGFDQTNLEFSKQQETFTNQNRGFASNNNQEQPFANKQSGENSNYQQRQGASNFNNSFLRISIPNAGGILTLGILSILSLCCCGGFIAPILSIIALAMLPKANRAYKSNPDLYTESSVSSLKAGKITAIIGLVLASLFIIYLIVVTAIGNLNVNDVNDVINEAWNGTGY